MIISLVYDLSASIAIAACAHQTGFGVLYWASGWQAGFALMSFIAKKREKWLLTR